MEMEKRRLIGKRVRCCASNFLLFPKRKEIPSKINTQKLEGNKIIQLLGLASNKHLSENNIPNFVKYPS